MGVPRDALPTVHASGTDVVKSTTLEFAGFFTTTVTVSGAAPAAPAAPAPGDTGSAIAAAAAAHDQRSAANPAIRRCNRARSVATDEFLILCPTRFRRFPEPTRNSLCNQTRETLAVCRRVVARETNAMETPCLSVTRFCVARSA